MFTIEDIDSRLRAIPFEPLRVVTSAGETHEISRPELVVLGERCMILGIAAPVTSPSQAAGRNRAGARGSLMLTWTRPE